MKKFIHGMMFGAGFAVAFLAICAVALFFTFPLVISSGRYSTSQMEEVGSPPEITRGGRYLGSLGTYSGDFTRDNPRVLSSGPGRIVGATTVDGKPLAGLRLRLALNGNVLSQWATTEEAGQYEIGVPFGEYRIDGFELDTAAANAVLPGKIGHPQTPHTSGTFDIAAGAPGQGLNLAFVDPVVLDLSKNRFSADEEIVIRWHPYEGAQEYKVQIFASTDARAYGPSEAVFPWDECPVVKEPQINLADYGVVLKDGHYYTVHVEARADAWRPISKTPIQHDGFQFQIVD